MSHPIIEIFATGDEVVNGDVQDTNGSSLARRLVEEGFLITRHSALPDDRKLLIDGIREIAARADLCVMSGGLGPTEDDLTSEVFANVLGVELDLHEEAVTRMQERVARFGMRFSEKNLRSARLPRGALVMHNEVGTAPGFSVQVGKCRFFCLPGPPQEFHFFVEKFIVPWVRQNLPGAFGAVAQFKTLGWPESHLAERFDDFAKLYPQVQVGYRAHSPETWLKLTVRASNRAEALALLRPVSEEVMKRIGSTVFGTGKEELPRVVHDLLLVRNAKLATAESCTGGLISHLVTKNAGSSGYFVGGVTVYSNELKSQLLGVPAQVIESSGAVSREVAGAMARGAIEKLGADLSLSVTGIAGPTGATEQKPLGLVYLGIAWRENGQIQSRVLERKFRGDRDRVQRASALTALEILRRHLVGAESLVDGPA